MKTLKKITKWISAIIASFVVLFIGFVFLFYSILVWYAHDFALDYRTRDECLDVGSIDGDEAPCRALGMKYPEDTK